MNSETTTTLSQRDAYKLMLKEYPDVMDIVQMCQILDVSTKTGYRLIREGKICCIKVGRAYRIPRKMCRLQETFFLQTSWNNGLR